MMNTTSVSCTRVHQVWIAQQMASRPSLPDIRNPVTAGVTLLASPNTHSSGSRRTRSPNSGESGAGG